MGLRGRRLSWVLVTLLLLPPATARVGSAEEKLVLQLRWDHQFQFAGYYAALWQGYYADAGLEVELRSGVTSERRILKGQDEIAAGRAHFGIGGGDILVANDRGQPLVVCASIFQRSSIAFYALKEAGVSSPADLVGRRVATRKPAGLSDVELQAMLRAEGIDPDLVPTFPLQAGIEQLLAGEVISGYTIEIPYHAERLGLALSSLRPSDFGVDFYGDTLFAAREFVEQNPELVERFVEASLRGWEYALDRPEEIAAGIAGEFPRAYPVEDPEAFFRFQIEGVKELTLYPVVRLGQTNPARWQRMHAFLKEAGLVAGELDIESLLFDPASLADAEGQRRERTQRLFLAVLLGVALLFSAAIFALRLRHKAMRRNEERLRIILDSVADAITLHDSSGAIVFINEQGLRMIGASREGAAPPDVVDFSGPGMPLEKVPERYEEVWASGELAPFEWQVRRLDDGALVDVEVVLRRISLEGKDAILGTVRDITERKRAEEELGRNQELLRGILENSPSQIFIKDTGGRYLFVNRSFEEVFDFGRDEVLGKTDDEIFPSEIAEAFRRNDREALTSGALLETEEVAPHADGLHTSIVHKFPLLDEKGEGYALCGIATDITDRKKAKEALQEREARLRAIYQNVAAGIAVVDPAGRFLEVNDKWAMLLGYSKEEIVGKTFAEMTFPEELEESVARFKVLSERKIDSYRLEKRYVRKDGSNFWADLSVTQILDPEGKVEAVVGMFIDISDRKGVEEKLRQANREMEDFVYTVSHDLRTPLTPIIGYAELLKELGEGKLGEDALGYLDEIEKHGTKMLALMEDLLSLAEVGHLERPVEPVEAAEVAGQVLGEFDARIREGEVEVRLGDLPAVRVPWNLLGQIFENLIGNALRYGRGEGGIQIGGEEGEGRVRYYVRDHGPGIPIEERERIFETFHRGTTAKGVKGTGIGLAIVKKIACLYGGKAWVEETAGGGSTFWVEMLASGGEEGSTAPETSR